MRVFLGFSPNQSIIQHFFFLFESRSTVSENELFTVYDTIHRVARQFVAASVHHRQICSKFNHIKWPSKFHSVRISERFILNSINLSFPLAYEGGQFGVGRRW